MSPHTTVPTAAYHPCCRATRELHDTPSIFTSSITVSWLLAAAPNLNPANMAAVARLLVGRSCSTAGATEQQGAPDPSSTHAAEQQQQSSASASAAAGGVMRGLRDAGKGRAVLLRVGRQWKMMHEWLKQAEEREAQARMGVVPPPMPEPAKGVCVCCWAARRNGSMMLMVDCMPGWPCRYLLGLCTTAPQSSC